MTSRLRCWWDSAPELIESSGWLDASTSGLGPFVGVTTNPMLMLAACRDRPPPGRAASGWALYLACARRSASYLAERGLDHPFCVQLDPRAAFDTDAMLVQADQIAEAVPGATIKVPMTEAGIEAMEMLASSGFAINATWGFSVAQLMAAARALGGGPAPTGVDPRPHVVTIMEGRLGDLGLRHHLDGDVRALRAAECIVFESAYEALRPFRGVMTLLASSLRPGPGTECWHYGSKLGHEVILTLPPAFLRDQGLPREDGAYGRADRGLLDEVLQQAVVKRYAATDGFQATDFDTLEPLLLTHREAVKAMDRFEEIAARG